MHTKKGFTLIELLVVIAIIALLLSILMPALQKVKRQARTVACLANLNQWGHYFLMYTDDYDGKFQEGWWTGKDYSDTWVAILRPYYGGSEKLLCCPTAMKTAAEGALQPFTAWGEYGEERPSFEGLRGSYGLNAWIRNPPMEFKVMPDRNMRPTMNNWRTPTVQGAFRVPVLLGEQYYAGYPLLSDIPPELSQVIIAVIYYLITVLIFRF